jgi:hypothetical protein
MSFYKSGIKAEIYDYVSRTIYFSVSLALTALTVSHSPTISTLTVPLHRYQHRVAINIALRLLLILFFKSNRLKTAEDIH